MVCLGNADRCGGVVCLVASLVDWNCCDLGETEVVVLLDFALGKGFCIVKGKRRLHGQELMKQFSDVDY